MILPTWSRSRGVGLRRVTELETMSYDGSNKLDMFRLENRQLRGGMITTRGHDMYTLIRISEGVM